MLTEPVWFKVTVLLERVWLGSPRASVRTSDTLALGSTWKMMVMLGSDTLKRVSAFVSFSSTMVLCVMGEALARGIKIYGKKATQSCGYAHFSILDETDRVYLDHLGQMGQLYFHFSLAEHEAAHRPRDAVIRRVGIC